MNLVTAIQCFEQNLESLDPEKDSVAWNLSKGLYHLAKSLQVIEERLDVVIQRLPAA